MNKNQILDIYNSCLYYFLYLDDEGAGFALLLARDIFKAHPELDFGKNFYGWLERQIDYVVECKEKVNLALTLLEKEPICSL